MENRSKIDRLHPLGSRLLALPLELRLLIYEALAKDTKVMMSLEDFAIKNTKLKDNDGSVQVTAARDPRIMRSKDEGLLLVSRQLNDEYRPVLMQHCTTIKVSITTTNRAAQWQLFESLGPSLRALRCIHVALSIEQVNHIRLWDFIFSKLVYVFSKRYSAIGMPQTRREARDVLRSLDGLAEIELMWIVHSQLTQEQEDDAFDSLCYNFGTLVMVGRDMAMQAKCLPWLCKITNTVAFQGQVRTKISERQLPDGRAS